MRHLFIINPVAERLKGEVKKTYLEIEAFFRDMGMDNYDIHVTRFVRDAFGYVSRYIRNSPEPVRIHTMGGSGTLYEVVNAAVGLPNAQIAAYPMGNSNYYVRYFGKEREHMFRSLRNQVFSDVTPIDVMRYGNTYSTCFVLLGFEACVKRDAMKIEQYVNIPNDMDNVILAAISAFNQNAIAQNYNITIDGEDLSGEYLSVFIAGGPCYGTNLTPAPEAHPNDGLMDIYILHKMNPFRLLYNIRRYTRGSHAKMGPLVKHLRGKKISISSASSIIMSIDGEHLNEHKFSLEVIPAALDFVCPDGINVNELPRIYNKPDTIAEIKK